MGEARHYFVAGFFSSFGDGTLAIFFTPSNTFSDSSVSVPGRFPASRVNSFQFDPIHFFEERSRCASAVE